MKIYYDPITTFSRPLMMFAAEHSLPLEFELVSLMAGEHQSPDYLAINPNGCVPTLVDGAFTLTESSAILKYLADLADSPSYPSAPRDRARVNACMDWLVTNFHTAVGTQLAYPILFPDIHSYGAEALAELTETGATSARRWFAVLNDQMIGPDRNYVAGEELTIADYVGGSILAVAEAVEFDLKPYGNVRRWLAGLKARPSWDPTFAAFAGLLSAWRSLESAHVPLSTASTGG